MECLMRKGNLSLDSKFHPDVKVYCKDGSYRMAHRIIISRLSHLLDSVLRLNEEEEDLALILPDVPGQMIDLMLELAYVGWVGGLALNNISQVRDVCKILDITQSDFVVRSEEKSTNRDPGSTRDPVSYRDPTSTVSRSNETTNNKSSAHIEEEPGQQDDDYGSEEEEEEEIEEEDDASSKFVPDTTSRETSSKYLPEEDTSQVVPDFRETRNMDQQGAFQCETCNKTFIFAKSFERHQEVCHDRQLAAAQAGQKSRKSKRKCAKREVSSDEDDPGREEGLEEGEEGEAKKFVIMFKFEHFEEIDDEYFCRFPGCQYKSGFKSLENCKNHQLLLHASDQHKLYKCDVCDKKFASNRLRNKHMNLMHNKRFECDVCDKRFSETTQLRIHQRIHTGEKPFVCQLCGYSCTQRSNLVKHNRLRHPATSGPDEARLYTCQVCHTSFNTKSNLNRHSRLHQAAGVQRPIICELCGKKFKDKGGLNQHIYSHGPAQYNCQHCDAKFTSPLYLSRHVSRKHPLGGVQPFTCQICDKGFPVNHQLQIHIQAVHQKLKHSCPNCNQLMGRKNSLYRHLKNGKCPGLSSTDGGTALLKAEAPGSEGDLPLGLGLAPDVALQDDVDHARGVSLQDDVDHENTVGQIPLSSEEAGAGGDVEMTADDVFSGIADMTDLGGVVTAGAGADIVPSYQMLVAQQFVVFKQQPGSEHHT